MPKNFKVKTETFIYLKVQYSIVGMKSYKKILEV